MHTCQKWLVEVGSVFWEHLSFSVHISLISLFSQRPWSTTFRIHATALLLSLPLLLSLLLLLVLSRLTRKKKTFLLSFISTWFILFYHSDYNTTNYISIFLYQTWMTFQIQRWHILDRFNSKFIGKNSLISRVTLSSSFIIQWCMPYFSHWNTIIMD